MANEILIFNDLHLADDKHRPRGRKPGYMDEGLDMLIEVLEIAEQRQAEAVVCSGDFFHHKKPEKNSHRLIQDIIGIIGTRPRPPVYVVPGNHDMGPEGINSLHDQPLGVLHQAGSIFILQSDSYTPVHHIVTPSGIRIVPRAYNQQRDADPGYYELHEKYRDYDDGPTVLVAHGSIVPPGTRREYPTTEVDLNRMKNIDVIAAGHIHEDLGSHFWHFMGGTGWWYTNVGALGRTARTEANLTRTVKIVSIHNNTAEGRNDPEKPDVWVEEIPLKSARPANEIFYEPEEAEEHQEDDISEFVRRLKENTVFEKLDLKDLVRNMHLEEELAEAVVSYLEDADD